MSEPSRDAARWRRELLHDITRLDWSRLDFRTGLRAAVFVVTPMLVGAATGYLFQGLLATIGANFLANTEGSGPKATPLRNLAAACLIEPAAIALGTLTGSTGALAIPLVGLGVFVFLMLRASSPWVQVALITAVVYVVGVGLPGASVSSGIERLWTSMAGSLWAFLGVALQRSRGDSAAAAKGSWQASQDSRHLHPFLSDFSLDSEVFRQALVTAIAAVIGLAIGVWLGLPRDIWIMITVIVAVRPGVGPTMNSTVVLVVGTAVGALVATAVTLEIGSLDALVVLLLVFAFGMFASRLVNQALFQALLTPFLIILLNIIYPGDWWFALQRIADVAIGGAVAVTVVYLLCMELRRTSPGRQARVPS